MNLENMTLYFITGNKGKLSEVQAIIDNVEAIDLDLPEIQELDPIKIITEKLKEATKENPGNEYFVEDTSLYFKCLNGFPGPLIKWLLQSVKNEGIYEMVSKYENQTANAKTVIGYSNGDDIHFFTGELSGTIVAPRGDKDFGWGPIFQPDGYQQTFAEMNREVKNKLSMRNDALQKLKAHLSNY